MIFLFNLFVSLRRFAFFFTSLLLYCLRLPCFLFFTTRKFANLKTITPLSLLAIGDQTQSMRPRYQYKGITHSTRGKPSGVLKFQRPRRKCGSDNNWRIGKLLWNKFAAPSGKYKRLSFVDCVRRRAKLFSLETHAANTRLFVIFDTAQETWRLEEFCGCSGVANQRKMSSLGS